MKRQFRSITMFVMIAWIAAWCTPSSFARSSQDAINCKETICRQSAPMSPSSMIFDQNIAVQVGADGRFNIGAYPNSAGSATSNSWDLMFSWPGSPWSSYTTIRIDGRDFIYGSSGTQVEAPVNTDARTNHSAWQINDMKVIQDIQIVANPQTGLEDLVKISYKVQNLGSVARSVGNRVMIDTEINYNDGAVFRLPNRGIIKTETDLSGTEIPDNIQSFFSINDSQHTAVSMFKNNGATAPDRLILAQWDHLYASLFTYSVNPNFDFTNPNVARPDSAYAAYWNPITLTPRAEQTYVTYYGLSNLTADLQPPLGLGVNGPVTLAVRGSHYSPEPFLINATVSNISAAAVNNVQVTLGLPPELQLVSGSTTQVIGNLGAGQENSTINWNVQASAQSSEKLVSYTVTVAGTNVAAKILTRSIRLPRVEPVTPLIFIPGIAGSYLDQPGIFSCNLWPRLPKPSCPLPPNAQNLSLDVSPNLVATDAIRSIQIPFANSSFYESLLKKLTGSDGGYIEATNGSNPLERCQQSSSSSTLYVFAYDWRKSNSDSASELKKLVDCIRQKHPDSFVNILTHSMGGLVARRYILDHMTLDAQGNHEHYVDKLVTIAAPWLGAPKFIDVLRNGTFFDKDSDYIGTRLGRDTIKMLVKSFIGAHELLPTKKYFELGGRPVGSALFNISSFNLTQPNEYEQLLNQSFPIRPFERDEYERWLDRQFPNVVAHSNDFHKPPQDDWNRDGDSTGVNYFQIYGSQLLPSTIETVVPDILVPGCDTVNQTCIQFTEDQFILTEGDGTVPLISASRINGQTDFNPHTDPITLWHLNSADAEHTDMTKNFTLQNCVLKALQPATRPNCTLETVLRPSQSNADAMPQAQPTVAEPPAYRLTVRGVPQVTVSDQFGNTTDTLSGTLTVSIPNAVYYRLGELSQLLILPADQPYTATFRVGQYPLAIDLTNGTSTLNTLAVRYRDVVLPANSNVMLRITPQGIAPLRADTDGNGSFETEIAPTVSLTGPAANDIAPPTITVNHTGTLNQMTVTLLATDAGSGVKQLLYSLDGTTFQPYTTPFTVDATKTPILYAFADDNAANRSGLLAEPLAYQLYLPLNMH